ncbi:MAG: type ISP restriction/modification enzyme [bacterium]|nr:type ISP restriction/modification enzyme [bacterium]
MLDIKPTHKPIKEYFTELEAFATHGHTNEMTVRNAFQDLLQHYSRKLSWQFIEEYPIKRKGRRDASVDGALLDQFSLARGFWEAKDTHDNLPTEVAKKFADGYPQTNILFWQPGRVILYQDARLILDEDISTPAKLVEILNAFFTWDQPYIREWEHAVEEFKSTIPTLAESVLKILKQQKESNRPFREAFDRFYELVKASVNPGLSVHAVEEMLIQHILTRRIFTTIFNSPTFLQKNAVAREIEGVVSALVQGFGTVDDFLKPLDRFYKALELAAGINEDYSQKQTFLNVVYEKFFQGFAVKVADTHGIVYTPQPIVDFMVKSVEAVLQKDFGKGLAAEGVHILDPFVGTGNFILRVMREIHAQKPEALRYKYLNELHCNELMLLPYYIACLNIEHLFFELTGQYEPFPGICLVDTFELVEDRQIGMFTSDNTDRVQRQKDSPIYVVIGNPPYNAGQVNENDNNKNRKYPAIDKRVAETYGKASKASNKNDLIDPYIKAFRFASDRILASGEGIVCLVTNSGFIEGIAFDGVREHLRRDFNVANIIDLGGNVRKNPKLSGTTHNVFGIQVGVAISLLERLPVGPIEHRVQYARMGEYLTKRQKYEQLNGLVDIYSVDAAIIKEHRTEVWLTTGMAADWDELIDLGSKDSKAGKSESVFYLFTLGLTTNRDTWAYDFRRTSLVKKMSQMIEFYNTHVYRWMGNPTKTVDEFCIHDDTQISWSRDLKVDMTKGKVAKLDSGMLREAAYRPFTLQHLASDRILNEEVRRWPTFFPLQSTGNLIICVSAMSQSKPFHVLAVDRIPDLHLTGDSQCFPLWIYDVDGSNRRDNISDWGLEQFQSQYKDACITKLDIFHYVYGIMHSPQYCTKYAANLKRELPRVPFAPAFQAFAEAGKQLMDQHVNYEEQPEFALTEVWAEGKPKDYRVVKMKRASKDPTKLIYNESLTLVGIPIGVDDYKLGNRSALNWIVDQYQVSTDKRSGITNDPNREDDPTYIVRLIKKVVGVSMETNVIVKNLPRIS